MYKFIPFMAVFSLFLSEAKGSEFSSNRELLETVEFYQSDIAKVATKQAKLLHRSAVCASILGGVLTGISLPTLSPSYQTLPPMGKIAVSTVTSVGFTIFYLGSYALLSRGPDLLANVRDQALIATADANLIQNLLQIRSSIFTELRDKVAPYLRRDEFYQLVESWLSMPPNTEVQTQISKILDERATQFPIFEEKLLLKGVFGGQKPSEIVTTRELLHPDIYSLIFTDLKAFITKHNSPAPAH